MSYGLVLCVLLATIAHAACPCPAPNVEYCNHTAPVSANAGYTCASFGTGHFHTFDGSVYNFHEYGDFWLVQSKPVGSLFAVQSRMLDCHTSTTQAVSLDATTGISATCNRAFAWNINGVHFQISHDLSSQNLNVYFNDVLQPPQSEYVFGVTTIDVNPIEYVNPYEETWRDQQAYLPDADFWVDVTVIVGLELIKMRMIFYSTGSASIIIRLDAGTGFVGNLAGLCGFLDNCMANDLYFPSISTFNPPTGALSNAASYIATVTDPGLTEGKVAAGQLVNGDQFIVDGTRPDKWAALFGAKWRVAASASLFFNDGKNYNVRHTATSYPSAGSCGTNQWFPNGAPSWLLQQCGLDRATLNDPDHIDTLASFHVFAYYCVDYCNDAVFSFHNPDLQPYQCNGICQFPIGVTPDIHGPFDESNLPTFDNSQPDNRASVLFIPTLGLSGDYFFSFMSEDYCEDRTFTVRKRITCDSGFDMDKPQNRSVQRSNSYDYPYVQILGKFPDGTVRADWTFVSTPATTIQFALSPYPLFLLSGPGDSILELAAYDGCQVARRQFVVTASCSTCVAPARIDLNQIKEILWGLNFNDASTGPVLAGGVAAYPAKQVNSIDRAADAPLWAVVTHNWTLTAVESSLSFLTLDPFQPTNPKLYHVITYPDQSVSDFAMMYPNGSIVSVNTTDSSINTTNTLVNSPINLPALKGPIATQFGVVPPQREYDIVRAGTRVIDQTVMTDTFANITVTQFANTINPCNLRIDSDTSGTATVTPVPVPSTSFNDQFLPGSLCEGEYVLELEVEEVNCNSSSDLQHVEVSCTTPPEAFVACDKSTAFNYNTQSFPSVILDASASRDPYGRSPLRYLYTPTVVPTGSAIVNPICGALAADGCTTNTVTFTPDVPGEYDFQVSVSNKCTKSDALAVVTAYCPQPLSSLTAFVTVTPPVVQFDGTTGSLGAVFDGSTSSSTASTILNFAWGVATAPPNPFPAYVPNATIGATNNQIFNVGFTYDGNYTIRAVVGQGCGQSVTVDQTIQVQCDATIAASFTANPTGPVITWDDGTGGFPNLALTSTSTFNFAQHPLPAGGVQQFQWNFPASGIPSATGATTNFNPPNNTETSYRVDLLATDGCRYSMNSQTFTYRCQALTATISGATGTISSGTTLTLTANAGGTRSTIPVTVLSWSFVSAPSLNSAAFVVTGVNTASVTLFAGGQYQIRAVITDGCTTANATVAVTVTCPQNLVARTVVPANQITWMTNAFARVDLNGNTSDTGGRPIGDPSISVRWLISGPMYSAYYAPTGVVTMSQSAPTTVITPAVIGNYTFVTNTTTIVTTTTTQDYEITLPLATNEPLLNFPTCFYPDVAGTYSLTLELTDACQMSTAPVTVDAMCGSVPTINITARERDGWNATAVPYVKEGPTANTQNNYTWTVTLTRNGLRRVHFDASRTTVGSSGGRLSYYWSWRDPDVRANTTNAQEGIDLPYGPQAEIVFPSVGTYYLLFTVHDGCAMDQANITVIAICDTKTPDVDFNNGSTITRDGSTTSVIQLQNTRLNDGVDPLTCTNAQWTFYNFTEFSPTGPVTGSGARVVVSFVPFVVALLLSLLSLP